MTVGNLDIKQMLQASGLQPIVMPFKYIVLKQN